MKAEENTEMGEIALTEEGGRQRRVTHRSVLSQLGYVDLPTYLAALENYLCEGISEKSFMEILFTCHTFHLFKMYDSVICVIVTELCNHHHN